MRKSHICSPLSMNVPAAVPAFPPAELPVKMRLMNPIIAPSLALSAWLLLFPGAPASAADDDFRQSLELLTSLLAHDQKHVRGAAAAALGELGPSGTRAALTKALRD